MKLEVLEQEENSIRNSYSNIMHKYDVIFCSYSELKGAFDSNNEGLKELVLKLSQKVMNW